MREDGSCPFVYDRGTQTVHLAPEGSRHGQIFNWVGNKMQGPTYNGWHDGYTIQYHSAPNQGERAAIEQKLQQHTGQRSLEDVYLHGDDFAL